MDVSNVMKRIKAVPRPPHSIKALENNFEIHSL